MAFLAASGVITDVTYTGNPFGNGSISSIWSFSNLGMKIAGVLRSVVDWSFTPLHNLFDDFPILDELVDLLPSSLSGLTVLEAMFGSGLLVVLGFHVIRFVRTTFF